MEKNKQCPLCGKDNKCKTGGDPCWCFHVKVPKELLDKIPPEKRGKSCVCLECIEKFNKEQGRDI